MPWFRCRRWHSSWATTASITWGGARISRQQKLSVPRREQLPQRVRGSRIVTGGAALVVAATVFRSEGAVRTLKKLRLVGFAYVAAIVAVAIWRVWQQGGL